MGTGNGSRKNIMENFINKESYLQRRTEQLRQWERVMDKLILRADKAKNDQKTELAHHIVKIQEKKAKTEFKLRQLQESGNEKWDDFKVGLEKSWVELREAFLEASARPK